MVNQEKREVGGWWLWMLFLLVITVIVFALLNSLGIIGKTVIEREVFERSHQYCQARQSQIATYDSQLVELKGRLSDPAVSDSTKVGLKAQKSAIKIKRSSELKNMKGCD